MESPFAVIPKVGMCTEIIALSLQQIGGQKGPSITVVIRQSRTEGRHRNAHGGSHGQHLPPGVLPRFNRGLEIWIQQQVLETGILIEGFLDAIEELGSNDATASPEQGTVPKMSGQSCSSAAACN